MPSGRKVSGEERAFVFPVAEVVRRNEVEGNLETKRLLSLRKTDVTEEINEVKDEHSTGQL